MRSLVVLCAVATLGPACVAQQASMGTLATIARGKDGRAQLNVCSLTPMAPEKDILASCGAPLAEMGVGAGRRPQSWCNIYRDAQAHAAGLPFMAICFEPRELPENPDCEPGTTSAYCGQGSGVLEGRLSFTVRLADIPALSEKTSP